MDVMDWKINIIDYWWGILQLDQMQLGLPGRDYYLKTSSARDLKAYHRYMVPVNYQYYLLVLSFSQISWLRLWSVWSMTLMAQKYRLIESQIRSKRKIKNRSKSIIWIIRKTLNRIERKKNLSQSNRTEKRI